MATIKKINFPQYNWISISHPDHDSMQALQDEYDFHPLNVQDCLSYAQRGKIDIHNNYTYFVLLFPVYVRNKREIKSVKINFFIGKKILIVVNQDLLKELSNFFKVFETDKKLRSTFKGASPETLLYEILNHLLAYCFPIIDHLIADCDDIEKKIFSGKEKKMISEILTIRRNITDVRKIMQGHKYVLKKLILYLKQSPLYELKTNDVYFEDLVDSTKEIWSTLENLKERIEALQQTNESQISFKLSDIMKTLTIISVITFPVTLIASIFGMNTVDAMPFINHPFGFWMVLAIMVGIIVFMLALFKRRGWI